MATHVCDSIKRQLKVQGADGLQGEFGIGLLSFWTLGEELLLTSASADGRTFQMHLKMDDPSYRITHRPTLFAEAGSEVLIRGILPGVKNFSGDKIQWYLASELRDRIRHSGVSIRVVDRTARAEYRVEPRQFEGRLLHELDGFLPPQSDVYAELYLHAHLPANAVSLLALPAEEYDWFDLRRGEGKRRPRTAAPAGKRPFIFVACRHAICRGELNLRLAPHFRRRDLHHHRRHHQRVHAPRYPRPPRRADRRPGSHPPALCRFVRRPATVTIHPPIRHQSLPPPSRLIRASPGTSDCRPPP